jgi:hypothetical protein
MLLELRRPNIYKLTTIYSCEVKLFRYTMQAPRERGV